MPPKYTMVRVSKSTRERLAEIEEKRETYNDIINRLIEYNEKRRLEGYQTK